MRKWNDKGSVPLKHKKIYFAAIVGTFLLAISHYFMYGYFSIENIAGMFLGGFLIYGIWFGGVYKIAKYFAERRVKQFDNDWDPHWTK